ncbi:MAG: dimethylargininase, partial [Acidimicrobiia bacterium]|nr:dimethylargininase [Acidimicrobiia bacterium]
MLTALTRPTGPELSDCELTYLEQQPIDVDRAIDQHRAYVDTLRLLGVAVVELPRLPQQPDAVFVEDTAVVLPEVAVLLRPGAESRLGEVASVGEILGGYRKTVHMEAPATLDGGDVLVLGNRILVGITTRSTVRGLDTLAALLRPFDYSVEPVRVTGFLHLKSAATAVDEETLIVNPIGVDLSHLGLELLEVPPDEPQGANVVRVGSHLLADATAPRTLELLRTHGADVVGLE